MAEGPLIVTALFGEEDFAWLDGLRRAHFPPGRNQVPAHLTLFHHLPPSVADELNRRLAAEAGGGPCEGRIAGLLNLGGGVAFRVESPMLEDIRARLADAFDGVLIPQDRAGWRPHVTIQNKVAADVARRLLKSLEAEFRPRPVMFAGLAVWIYERGPWRPLSRHLFTRSGPRRRN